MLPVSSSTTPPDPATDLGDQTSYLSPKYRWLQDTSWKFNSLGSRTNRTRGFITISGYRKGYFWGEGLERGSNETFEVLGSITPEGNFFLNAIDKDDFELRFSEGGLLQGPRRQAKAKLRPYTNNQDQFDLPLRLRRIDAIQGKDLITEGGDLLASASRPGAANSAIEEVAGLEWAGASGLVPSDLEWNGGDGILAAMGVFSDPGASWLN